MASSLNSASFQAPAHRNLQAISAAVPSAYPRPPMAQSHAAPPFEGIVDFTYPSSLPAHQQSFTGYPTGSDLVPQHVGRLDGTEWKQSSFFSYRPNEVKHRKRTTRQQLKVLEETFRTTQKPDGNLRKTLAVQLDMTPRNVQVWFQNRRAKDKTLAKRAQKSLEEQQPKDIAAGPADAIETSSPMDTPNVTSPVDSIGTYVQSDVLSPLSSHPTSSVTSPIDALYSQHDAIVESVNYGSDNGSSQQPLAYPRHIFAPRGSLPHIQAVPYSQDFQHQRSNSSPAFLTSVDNSNLSLTTYASINGILYPQQSHPMYPSSYSSSASGISAGPLPASDFVFGMPARPDADRETEATFSHIRSVSGSDTPSSLSHYGSVASFNEHGYEEEVVGAPTGWQPEQRRGSNALTQGGMSSRGYSPLSATFAQSSPRSDSAQCLEAKVEYVDNVAYPQSWSSAYSDDAKPYPSESYAYERYVYSRDANIVPSYANVEQPYNIQPSFAPYQQAPVGYTYA